MYKVGLKIQHERILSLLNEDQVKQYKVQLYERLNHKEKTIHTVDGFMGLSIRKIKTSYHILKQIYSNHTNDEGNNDVRPPEDNPFMNIGDALSVILEFRIHFLSDVHKFSLVSSEFCASIKGLKCAGDNDVIKALNLYRCTYNIRYIDSLQFVHHITLSLYINNCDNVMYALKKLSTICIEIQSLSILSNLDDNVLSVLSSMNENANIDTLKLILTKTKTNSTKIANIAHQVIKYKNIKTFEIICIDLRTEWHHNSLFLSTELLNKLNFLSLQYTAGTATNLLNIKQNISNKNRKTLQWVFGPRNTKFNGVQYDGNTSAIQLANIIDGMTAMTEKTDKPRGRASNVISTMVRLFKVFNVIQIEINNQTQKLTNPNL